MRATHPLKDFGQHFDTLNNTEMITGKGNGINLKSTTKKKTKMRKPLHEKWTIFRAKILQYRKRVFPWMKKFRKNGNRVKFL